MSRRSIVPPERLALWLLRAALPATENEPLIGDLVEEAATIAAERGDAAARRWLWRQSIIAVLTLRRGRRAPLPRTTTGDPPMLRFLADLRHGVRLLRRAPAFTLLSVLTLALGVGATTAIFSVADPVLFQPLPYPAADRIAIVGDRDADGTMSNVGFLTYRDLARDSRTLERAAAAGDWQVTLDDHGAPERVAGQRVSASFFSVLGVRPALGRDFSAAEDTPGTNTVVILSHGLWARRYGGDTALVGSTVSINGAPYTVAGVLPASFESVMAPGAQIWRVLGYDASLPYACRTCRHLRMVARTRAGVTLDGAAVELSALSARLVREYPKQYPAAGAIVVSLGDATMRGARPVLWAVLGASALVLLIAAANVANLQLARAMRREEEFAIRAALGAGRGRLTAQLLAEGLVLAIVGGVVGLLVARVTLGTLIGSLPPTMPRLSAIRLDQVALAVGAGYAPPRGRDRTGARAARPAERPLRLAPGRKAPNGRPAASGPGCARRRRGRSRIDAARRRGPPRPEPRPAARGRSRFRRRPPADASGAGDGTEVRRQLGGVRQPRPAARSDPPAAGCRARRHGEPAPVRRQRRHVRRERSGQAARQPGAGARPRTATLCHRSSWAAMGIAIRRGRAFTAADNSDAAPNVVIVSAGLASRILAR